MSYSHNIQQNLFAMPLISLLQLPALNIQLGFIVVELDASCKGHREKTRTQETIEQRECPRKGRAALNSGRKNFFLHLEFERSATVLNYFTKSILRCRKMRSNWDCNVDASVASDDFDQTLLSGPILSHSWKKEILQWFNLTMSKAASMDQPLVKFPFHWLVSVRVFV